MLSKLAFNRLTKYLIVVKFFIPNIYVIFGCPTEFIGINRNFYFHFTGKNDCSFHISMDSFWMMQANLLFHDQETKSVVPIICVYVMH